MSYGNCQSGRLQWTSGICQDDPCNKRVCVKADVTFILCDFLNASGHAVERVIIVMEEGDMPSDRVRVALSGAQFDRALSDMRAEAARSGAQTSTEDAALALNALLNEIAGRRTGLSAARSIASVSINFRKAVTIAEIMPALETNFGGYAVSWARGVFGHLCLGTPRLQ